MNYQLTKCRMQYKKKKISKVFFINTMYRHFWSKLFEISNYIDQTDIKSIKIIKNSIYVTLKNNIKFFLSKGDKRTSPIEVMNFGKVEEIETDIIKKLVKNNFVFVDVGANIGWHSINLAKKYKNIKIYAFEPIPATFQMLNRNISLNKIRNINSFNKGLYNQNVTRSIFYDPSLSGNASLKNVKKKIKITKIKCKMATMDSIFYKNKKKVDFIKCDVEGSEYLFLKGAIKTLRKYKPTMLIEILRKWSKFFVSNPNKIFKYLNNIGYVSFCINKSNIEKISHINKQTKSTNFLFVHETKIISFLKDLKKYNIKQ